MKTIISIDDTDNEHSPGSGQLADDLAQELILTSTGHRGFRYQPASAVYTRPGALYFPQQRHVFHGL